MIKITEDTTGQFYSKKCWGKNLLLPVVVSLSFGKETSLVPNYYDFSTNLTFVPYSPSLINHNACTIPPLRDRTIKVWRDTIIAQVAAASPF